jgi:protein-S-isoprenylcysteine O-methyltransferase Ste14
MPPLVLALLFTLGWVPLFVFRAEALSEAFPSYGFGERFWVVAAPALVGFHVAASCLLVTVATHIPPGRAAVAVILYVGGVVFWLWARGAIGPIRVTRLPDEPPARLRRDGAFGLVRNPLYFGTLLAAAAPAIAAGRSLLVLSFAAAAAALVVRSVQEERRLHAQLGREYADYCREVKRLVPFVW